MYLFNSIIRIKKLKLYFYHSVFTGQSKSYAKWPKEKCSLILFNNELKIIQQEVSGKINQEFSIVVCFAACNTF